MVAALAMEFTGASLAPVATTRRDAAGFSWRRAVLASLVFHVIVLAYPLAQRHLADHPLLPLTVALSLPLPVPESAELQAGPESPSRTALAAPVHERTISQPEPTDAVPMSETATPVLMAAPTTLQQPLGESRPVSVTPAKPGVARELPRTADAGALAGYNRAVAQAVDRFKRYPRIALTRNWQGTAVLNLNIGADGQLREFHLARSSGFDALDEQALAMLREAMPLPTLPSQLAGIDLSIDIPVVFRIAD